jgi:hypothetical protein
MRRILAIGSREQTHWLLTGHYVKMEGGGGCEFKMAVAVGVMCLGGVEQSQFAPGMLYCVGSNLINVPCNFEWLNMFIFRG